VADGGGVTFDDVSDGTASFSFADAVTFQTSTLYTGVNAASGSANPWDYTGTLGIMNGSDDFILFDVNLTNADHTGSTNNVIVLDVANITGDAHATETAISIGTGWDYGIATGSGVKIGSATAETITQVDTVCAAGTANAKWVIITVNGVAFAAVAAADTAKIVD
jgi:hypothetical protein